MTTFRVLGIVVLLVVSQAATIKELDENRKHHHAALNFQDSTESTLHTQITQESLDGKLQHPRPQRALWPTVRQRATDSAPGRASVSSSVMRTTTVGTTSTVVNYTDSFIMFPNSAINMAGQSYYVNYNTPTGSVLDIMAQCYDDVTCVSFDYTSADQQGWMHRVGHQCASAAGAQFIDGTTSASDFYELKPSILEARGINASQCSAVKSSYVVDLKPANMVGRVFAASLGTFIVTGLLLGAVWKFMQHREHERLIARVINQNAVLDDDELHRPLQHINEVLRNPNGIAERDRLVIENRRANGG